jgi:hypothetical protein
MNRFTVITAVIIITSSPTPSGKSIAQMTVKGGSDAIKDIFKGGSDSVVAIAVGYAEGTRTANGSKTSAYYGHSDPGNGVWNLGSFSFQHCKETQYRCSTPEEADGSQIKRLEKQTEKIENKTKEINIELNKEEKLNGIDLANQAPAAALEEKGYPERLKEAKEKGLKGDEAILHARVYSYWNPNTNSWDAPGLGNTEENIRHDQERRMLAIKRVLELRDKFGGR